MSIAKDEVGGQWVNESDLCGRNLISKAESDTFIACPIDYSWGAAFNVGIWLTVELVEVADLISLVGLAVMSVDCLLKPCQQSRLPQKYFYD